MLMEMINVSVTNITDRLCKVSKLKFLCPPDLKQFANYQRYFPIEALNFLRNSFGRCFDPLHLKSELVAVYYDAECHTHINKLHVYTWQQELQDVFLKPTSSPNSSSQFQLQMYQQGYHFLLLKQ